MSEHFERVEPTPFEAPRSEPAAAPGRGPETAGLPRWVMPALLVLAVLAAGVIFVLPGVVENGSNPVAPAQAPAAASAPAEATASRAAASETPAAPDDSPYADAQAARFRAEAQDILATLVDLQETLEERGAARWAPEAFESIRATAARGDEQYRERDFEASIASYQQALDEALALENQLPTVLAETLERATAAIESLEPEQAAEALDLASVMAPGDSDAAALSARLDALPAVIAAFETAEAAEAAGELGAARDALAEAVAADPDHRRATEELARLEQAWRDQQFARAMSEGYLALDENRFDAARAAFRRAGEYRPDAAEIETALTETETRQTERRLRDLRDRADSLVASERWSDAEKLYEEALSIDGSLLFAQRGLERARPRARLDRQLTEALDNPDRLSDPQVADATADVLRYARSIEPRGSVLAQQINRLESMLEKANTPIPVTLRSDSQTAVTVYKVARLGTFEQQTLELRPGKYTAVGTRIGYRDVRETFTVSHESPPGVVTIVCTEAI